jgi:hypothetical protein
MAAVVNSESDWATSQRRRMSDPQYRADRNAKNAEYRRIKRLGDPTWRERENARQRKRYAEDPAYRARALNANDRKTRQGMCPQVDQGCEICGIILGRSLHWDHNHETGQFRGWLCNSCNNGLGRFKDQPFLLRAAADYLEGVI